MVPDAGERVTVRLRLNSERLTYLGSGEARIGFSSKAQRN